MKHTFVATALFFILSLFGTEISAQRYQEGLIDKTIVLIGNDMIMLSDLENEVQMMSARGFTADRNVRCQILEEMLVSKLFLNQARIDSLDVNEANVENALNQRINEVMTQLGGEKQMEEYFNKPLYKLRQEWREMLTEQSLIQDMQRKVAGNIPNLTPSDIEKYCKETPEEDLPIVSTQYRIRQIVLYPDKEAAELEVKERLLDLRERIVAGERFSTLARLYSQDPGSYAK